MLSDEDKAKVGHAAMEAMDEMTSGGALDKPGAVLRAVAVIVAVDHDDQTSIDYRFRRPDGADLDKPTGQEMLRRVQEAIT